jgi:hypothetical protein
MGFTENPSPRGEVVCIKASAPAPVGATHRPYWNFSLRELNPGMLARKLREFMFPFLGQRKSVIAKGKVTLECQLLFRCQHRALLG